MEYNIHKLHCWLSNTWLMVNTWLTRPILQHGCHTYCDVKSTPTATTLYMYIQLITSAGTILQFCVSIIVKFLVCVAIDVLCRQTTTTAGALAQFLVENEIFQWTMMLKVGC